MPEGVEDHLAVGSMICFLPQPLLGRQFRPFTKLPYHPSYQNDFGWRNAARIACRAEQPQANADAPQRTADDGVSRRSALFAAGGVAISGFLAARPAQALPLAPLGNAISVGGSKLTGLTTEQVKASLGCAFLNRTLHCFQ